MQIPHLEKYLDENIMEPFIFDGHWSIISGLGQGRSTPTLYTIYHTLRLIAGTDQNKIWRLKEETI